MMEKPELEEVIASRTEQPVESFEEEEEEFEEVPSAMEFAFRQAMGDDAVDDYSRGRKRSRKSRKRKRARQAQKKR